MMAVCKAAIMIVQTASERQHASKGDCYGLPVRLPYIVITYVRIDSIKTCLSRHVVSVCSRISRQYVTILAMRMRS